ncbi:DUF1194 domain-containing protein [Nitratiruptor sp. YY09-18]|uniref:DUF1194 domain-containing protein n=1 Tax=Nitratiruptor sp. YY09-18 TaxID=2724901 RepID=UPI001915E2C0|nr:DUF1194 domain-containing protein [Nitratiruptor sp. YY09-18]BCD68928.1 hypothetical protein NitYY0918_C1851 [Nitratiruptor sp. YY09-18]
MKFFLRIVAVGLVLLNVSGFAASVQRDICLLLDGSGSIGSSDWQLQLQANADAIKDPNIVPQDGSIAISVVQFSSTAQVEVSRTIITDQTTADNVANQILSINQMGGGTYMSTGINTCAQTIDTTNSNTKKIIDISTDGQASDLSATLTAADNAYNNNNIIINAIGVGSGVDVNELNQIVRPQPASQIPNDGFVVLAPDYQHYNDSLKEKLKAETGQVTQSVAVPLSNSSKLLMIFGIIALVGFFYQRRESSSHI